VWAVRPAAAADLHMLQADRSPIRWQEWLDANGRSAVLVWSSWAPEGREALREVGPIQDAARKLGLGFVIVDVQEVFEDAEEALGRVGVPWLHDRHGSILKKYRLIKVPILLVVDREAGVEGRFDPSPEALASWGG